MSKILVYPNKILREKTQEIKKIDKKLKTEISLLKKELEGAENGAGLAAPQIGISKSFFGIKGEDKKVKIFINPKIKITFGDRVCPKLINDKKEEEDFLEGCLSFPDFFGTVKRFLKISVEWVEIKDKKLVSKVKELTGFEAIVWQHESDHLDGILLIDHLKNEGGKLFKWNGKEMVEWSVEKII